MSSFKEISAVIAALKNPEDVEEFLLEILTENERKDLSLRWDLLRRLHAGETQRGIAAELGISLCRITRGSKILKSEKSIVRDILEGKLNQN